MPNSSKQQELAVSATANDIFSLSVIKTDTNKPMLNSNSYAIITGKKHWGKPRVFDKSTLNSGTFTWNSYLELLLGTSELLQTFTWNPCLELRNLPKPTCNLGTSWNLYAEPLFGTSETAETLPLLGTPFLEPSLGTHLEPRNLTEPCSISAPGPSLLVWLRPQSFQLLGKNDVKDVDERIWDMLRLNSKNGS